ncbi:MAG: alkaline phosphatase [Coriobacteriia bacterium]|nr:alkaline phosphatase [Coriobacteriia bacterium]
MLFSKGFWGRVVSVAVAASLLGAQGAFAATRTHTHTHSHIVRHRHSHVVGKSHSVVTTKTYYRNIYKDKIVTVTVTPEAPKLKNVIVLISDGMGYDQAAVADYFTDGHALAQPWENFPTYVSMATYPGVPATMTYDPFGAWSTFNYNNINPTDSAAAGTAMACGVKSFNAGVGVDVNNVVVKSVTERAKELGKSTGVISSVPWTHATPATYATHNISRNDLAGIARGMVNTSTVDVIMGGGHPFFTHNGEATTTATYKYIPTDVWSGLTAGTAGNDNDADGVVEPWSLIQTRAQFQALTTGTTPARVLGTAQVRETLQQARSGDTKADANVVPKTTTVPTLSEMTRGALNVLDNNPKGLFLMVEGGAVDWAGHANEKGRIIEEQVEFNDAVKDVISWVNTNSNWDETLVVVTGDHETGYITGPNSGQSTSGVVGPVFLPVENKGAGTMPGFQFNSTNHTNQLIPFYAKGNGAGAFVAQANKYDPMRARYMDNTAAATVLFDLWK